MSDPQLEFTNVTALIPEAVGEPGQRMFRLVVNSGTSSGILWLEKEQLFQLALAINQLVATLPDVQARVSDVLEAREAPPSTHLEFKVEKLVLGYETNLGRFIIDTHDVEAADEAPTLRLWGTPSLMKKLAEEALQVCAAGRPLCPLCGNPIDKTGHKCARSNGHGIVDLRNI